MYWLALDYRKGRRRLGPRVWLKSQTKSLHLLLELRSRTETAWEVPPALSY